MPKSKYDPFFSRSMEHRPIAQAFFSQHLPKHIRQLVDLDTLVRVDRTNTNEKLAKRHRDIAYEAPMQGEIALLACAEHQSQPDIMMPVRFLHYGADGITPYLKEHKKIPIVVQFLFYNGEPSPYPYPNTLQAYYGHPEWGSQELALRFYLIDATQISDEELLKHGHCAPMALLLKHGRDGNFALEIDAYRDVFQKCIAAVGDEYIFTMLNYATELSNAAAGEKIFKFIEAVLINKTDIIMSYGQQLRQEGMQQGMQQEKLVIARNLLRKNMDVSFITETTGLDKKTITKLKEDKENKAKKPS